MVMLFLMMSSHLSQSENDIVLECSNDKDYHLSPALKLILAIGVGQVQKADGVLGWQLDLVGVEVLQKGLVHGVGVVLNLNRVVCVFLPTALK